MKHKILYVIDNLEFGGGERGFLQLINGLYGKYDISVAAHRGGRFSKELVRLGVTFYDLPFNYQWNFCAFKNLIKIIRKNRFQIIHGQGSRAELYARLAYSVARQGVYVSTIQAPVEKYEVGRIKKTVYRLSEMITDKLVNRFIVVSEELSNLLANGRGIAKKKITKIPNGIEIGQIKHLSNNFNPKIKFQIPKDSPVVGAIGRLIWAKGYKYLIEAFRLVTEKIPNAKLVIAGDGPLMDDLVKIVKITGLSNSVVFTGFVEDPNSLMAGLDVLVLSSVSEGFPMVTLEGMALAKPIVATTLPGVMEQLQNEKSALLVPPRDAEKLGFAILDFLTDKAKASRIGSNAKKHVEENFSIQKMVTSVDHVYQEFLNSSDQRG